MCLTKPMHCGMYSHANLSGKNETSPMPLTVIMNYCLAGICCATEQITQTRRPDWTDE